MGYNYFRVHPKGTGLVCMRPGGLPPLTFVEEYLGEIHTPWRWFEIQVGFFRIITSSLPNICTSPCLALSVALPVALPCSFARWLRPCPPLEASEQDAVSRAGLGPPPPPYLPRSPVPARPP